MGIRSLTTISPNLFIPIPLFIYDLWSFLSLIRVHQKWIKVNNFSIKFIDKEKQKQYPNSVRSAAFTFVGEKNANHIPTQSEALHSFVGIWFVFFFFYILGVHVENGDGRGWEIATVGRFGYKVEFYKKMSKTPPILAEIGHNFPFSQRIVEKNSNLRAFWTFSCKSMSFCKIHYIIPRQFGHFILF